MTMVAQLYELTKITELYALNGGLFGMWIVSQSCFKNEGEINIFRFKKAEFIVSRLTLWWKLRKILSAQGKWYQREIQIFRKKQKASEIVNCWINTKDAPCLNFFKIQLTVKNKNYYIVLWDFIMYLDVLHILQLQHKEWWFFYLKRYNINSK